MPDGPPSVIAINHDDHYAQHIGRTSDGRQFFLTTPFEPALGDGEGRDFVALHVFDARGNLVEARIDDLGPTGTLDSDLGRRIYEQRLKELGDVEFTRIEIAPFAVERFGRTFGLTPFAPEEDGEPWIVEAQPGNYMAFFEPWDSGEYDT